MPLGEEVAKELSNQLEIPTAVAVEMITDMRLMNEDIDAAFYDDSENTVEHAQKLCEKITADPQLLRWLEKRTRIARESLETPPS
jgi:hypothetical protein